ncbi:DsbA family oxidoreductase [Novosphingobium sp. KCTC 2891]|uniref:DsbA family oxidoreductase n=1 Tax=Novosphingobium sp. KCTC 2891 TaxID=2989730 RepID=UPI0022218D94|nr:DsbA family oxidoreductase [Novosphingobium sp. KCTC 2891]MCW1382613.1 DsbA family oxidoreductase [Novosphingobium sp. KCTC 2891]
MSAPEQVVIDIWSDVMCPWCVIGTRQLEKALDELEGEIEAEIRFHPFELNPDMPPEGEDSAAHIMRKYGRTPEQAAQGRAQMKTIAESAGYSFDYAGPKAEGGEAPPSMMWNTHMAHRLLVWALRDLGPQVQARLKHALFDAHFQYRRNVSDPQVLLDIAEETGLDRTAAEAALADPEIDRLVHAGQRQAWDLNVSGVPAMVINGKFMVPGAQDPQTYASVLRKVIERERVMAERAG